MEASVVGLHVLIEKSERSDVMKDIQSGFT